MNQTKLGTLNFIYADDELSMHYFIPIFIKQAFPDYTVNCKSIYHGEDLFNDLINESNLTGIVTDHNMPRKTGSQALLEARLQKKYHRALIITGNLTEELEQDLRALKDVPVIRKPFDVDYFLAALRKYWPEYAPKQQ